MFISEHVTLGNDSCNLCRNKIARQVARKIAWCNSAFKQLRHDCSQINATWPSMAVIFSEINRLKDCSQNFTVVLTFRPIFQPRSLYSDIPATWRGLLTTYWNFKIKNVSLFVLSFARPVTFTSVSSIPMLFKWYFFISCRRELLSAN